MKRFCIKYPRMILLCFLLFLPLLGAGPQTPGDAVIPDISNRINEFTFDLLRYHAATLQADENTILSPQSIFHGMAMSYVASGGETRKELARVFHYPDNDAKLMKDLTNIRLQLRLSAKPKKIDVSLANSVWIDETYAIFQKEYIKKLGKEFSAELYSEEFKDGKRASKAINKWVAEKTRGKITEVIGPEAFQSQSGSDVIDEPALVSVNAVYFKADWASRFDKKATGNRAFHVDGSTVKNIPMMQQNAALIYAENDDFQFLEIPYVDNRFSMYVLLPKQIIGIKEAVSRLKQETVVDLKRKAYSHNVDVLFPLFEIRKQYNVADTLKSLGAGVAFDKKRADFDKMIVKKWEAYRIYISSMSHDAWIEVHEDGTKAAATTTTTHFSFGCSAPMNPTPAVFHADHPFLFAIVENKSYSILFAGWFANPKAADGRAN